MSISSKRTSEGDVTIAEMKAFCEARPFRPFIMHLADGRNIPVNHQEFIMAAPTGRTIAVYQPDGALHVIDLLLVADVELQDGNGARKRKKS
jgi:hypothetical protein